MIVCLWYFYLFFSCGIVEHSLIHVELIYTQHDVHGFSIIHSPNMSTFIAAHSYAGLVQLQCINP